MAAEEAQIPEQRTLRAVYGDAEKKRSIIEHSTESSNSPHFQHILQAAIQLYEECVDVAARLSLFSPNESLEDISTVDLPYLDLHYRIADLVLRLHDHDQRHANLLRAQGNYVKFLGQLENYAILSADDVKLFERYQDSPNTFSTASTADVAARRDTKIRRFKEEKALAQKLEYLAKNPRILQEDDAAARELHLTSIAYCIHQTFASLESIAQELHILSLAPPPSSADERRALVEDDRERSRRTHGYSERLDGPSHLSAAMKGPLLDSGGKPLRPFTLLAKEEMRAGVFRPDHSLPTMTIDEYLEEERKRGGVIEGGGPQSQTQKQVDEDDMEAADRETMKAREWDEYVEANPKGSGNTINRG